MLQNGDIVDELNSKWQQHYPGLTKLHFSNWVPWKQRNTIRYIDELGVYILAKYELNKVPQSVDPLDEHIIWVGKTTGSTTSLKARLNEFDRAAFGKGGYHAGGETYRRWFGTNQQDFYVAICPVYWADQPRNFLPNSETNLDTYMSFCVCIIATRLEVCLRGTYVYIWGRLPKLNKE